MRNGAGVDDVDHIRFGLDVLLGGDTTNGLAQSGDGARPRDDGWIAVHDWDEGSFVGHVVDGLDRDFRSDSGWVTLCDSKKWCL